MNREDMKYLISLYADGELEPGKEAVLFEELSKSDALRDYYRKLMLVKMAVHNDIKHVPENLDKKIYGEAAAEKKTPASIKINSFIRYMPYAAAVILLILALVYFRRSDDYQNQIINLTREIEDQNRRIELLYHALPPIEVYSNYKQTNNIKTGDL